MPLERGVYSITCKRTTGELPDILGRFPVEKVTFQPKDIFALPDGVTPPNPHVRADLSLIRALKSLAVVGPGQQRRV